MQKIAERCLAFVTFMKRFTVNRYMTVGGATGLIDTGAFTLILYVVGTQHYLIAASAGWILGYVANFTGHKFFTFQSNELQTAGREFLLHLNLKVFNFLLRLLLLWLFVEKLECTPYIGIVIFPCIAVWSFFATRWIFAGTSLQEQCRYLWKWFKKKYEG